MICSITKYTVLLLMFVTVCARAQVSGPSQPVVLEHADSLIGRKSTGEQVFDGNVRFVQGALRIETDKAVYNEAAKKIQMTGNVRITQPGMTMTAPTADYDGFSRMAYAPNGVVLQDTSGTLTAGAGEYSTAQKKATFRSGVQYVTGTSTVTADVGDYYSYNAHSLFRGNVRYQDGAATLTSEEGEYYSQSKRALFRRNVVYTDGKGARVTAQEGEFSSTDNHSHFSGDVLLKDTSGTINAGVMDYYAKENKAVFVDHVVVNNDSGMIASDKLIYRRDTRESYATGAVNAYSVKYATTLIGDTLTDKPNDKYTLVTGHAKMILLDTVRQGGSIIRFDTTTLTSKRIEAFRKNPAQYVATDDVVVIRGDMEAHAYIARYLPTDSVIGLGARPVLPRADSSLRGVTAKLDTAKNKKADTTNTDTSSSRGGVTGMPGNPDRRESQPVFWYRDAQLVGDTMTVRLVGRHVNTVHVDRDAFVIMQGKREGRYDQLTGATVTIAVRQDSIRQVEASGDAASISFMYDRQVPNGANRVAGDVIRIGFVKGQASRITVSGSKAPNNGEYFPEKFVAGRESYYRLTGFRWIDRRGGGIIEGGGVDNPESPLGSTSGRGGSGKVRHDEAPQSNVNEKSSTAPSTSPKTEKPASSKSPRKKSK